MPRDPPSLIVLCALAFHGPLLMMQVPANSFDANFHMSMASHYAHDWFDPWNEKAFAGFSQTTYPPLTHQWTTIFSHLIGLTNAYMLVQFHHVLAAYAHSGRPEGEDARPSPTTQTVWLQPEAAKTHLVNELR